MTQLTNEEVKMYRVKPVSTAGKAAVASWFEGVCISTMEIRYSVPQLCVHLLYFIYFF